MLKFTQGNIFESDAQTLMATVNCVGIMGKGLAKEFRQKYPEMFKEYAKACKKGELRKGHLFLYKDLLKWILCFPTKDNWKGPSKYEFIEEGLKAVRENYSQWGITSLAVPPLGCGLGGLKWDQVKQLIMKYLQDLPIEITVFEPLAVGERIPSKNPFRNMAKVKLTPAMVYTGEMIRIAREKFPKDFPIGRLLLQKIAFFSQMAGLPIKLKFKQYELGPYDHNLKYNVDRLEGLFVRDNSPVLKKSDLVMLDEEAWAKALESIDVNIFDARERIERAVNFLSNLNLHQIELASTAFHAWGQIVAGGQTGTQKEVVDYINEWKPGKFGQEEIISSLDSLIKNGWIAPDLPQRSSTESTDSANLISL